MTKLAFVGLGLMGTPMATRLLEAGNDLTVWNRTAEKTRPLADRGASVASTPAEAAVGVGAAITMVANPQALEQVVFGPDGLAAALRPGQLLIDMSTVGPATVREVAARLPQGVALVDGPGAGQRSRGDRRPAGHLRRRLPARVRPGRADPGRARHATRAKRANVESGSYPPNFKLILALKDLRLVDQTAQRAGRHLPLARASRDWLERAANSGAGDLDYSAVIATITDGGRSPA